MQQRSSCCVRSHPSMCQTHAPVEPGSYAAAPPPLQHRQPVWHLLVLAGHERPRPAILVRQHVLHLSHVTCMQIGYGKVLLSAQQGDLETGSGFRCWLSEHRPSVSIQRVRRLVRTDTAAANLRGLTVATDIRW